jgi:hypothetical protein
MIFHMTYLESHKLDTLDPKIEHGIVEIFQLDMENLKHLNWTSQNLKLGMVDLESFKFDTPSLEIRHCKPMIPQIEHGKREKIRLDIPNLEMV